MIFYGNTISTITTPWILTLSQSPPPAVSDDLDLLDVPSFTFHNFAPRQNLRWRNVTQSTDGQNLIRQLEQVIEKSKKKIEKIEVHTSISTCFNDAEKVSDGKYLEKIEDEKEELKEIEKGYNFWHIFKQINEGVIPTEIDFYFGGDNKDYFLNCEILGLSKDN